MRAPAKKKNRALPTVLCLLTVMFCALAVRFFLLEAFQSADTPESERPAERGDLPQTPDGAWQTVEMTQQQMYEGTLILVSNEVEYHAPQQMDLVTVYSQKTEDYYVKDTQTSVLQELLPHLNDWCAAARKATGAGNANVVAGHRTVEYQQELYDNALTQHGRDYAEQYIAHPGYSEHHTGLAIDFSLYLPQSGMSAEFDNDQALSSWMLEHAWQFGFVQRYPQGKQDITGIAFESWHFRYVSKPHAWYMQQNGLCLEEYLQLLRDYPAAGAHLCFTCDGTNYEVYFCQGLSCVVPTDAQYEISGNNVDGFVVTVVRDSA